MLTLPTAPSALSWHLRYFEVSYLVPILITVLIVMLYSLLFCLKMPTHRVDYGHFVHWLHQDEVIHQAFLAKRTNGVAKADNDPKGDHPGPRFNVPLLKVSLIGQQLQHVQTESSPESNCGLNNLAEEEELDNFQGPCKNMGPVDNLVDVDTHFPLRRMLQDRFQLMSNDYFNYNDENTNENSDEIAPRSAKLFRERRVGRTLVTRV